MAGRKDQSHMYSGLTSVSPTSKNKSKAAAAARDERIRKKQEAKHKLKGEIDVTVLAIEFKKEVDKLLYAPYTVDGRSEEQLNDHEFRIERRARRIAIKSLFSIQKRVANTLRESSRQSKAEAEAEDKMDLSTDDFDE
jgi:hypothetical protein